MLNAMRFSSIKDFFTKKFDFTEYIMKVPYTDTYEVKFKGLKKVEIRNAIHKVIKSSTSSFTIDLKKGDSIFLSIFRGKTNKINIKVTPLHNKATMPYEPLEMVNVSSLNKNAKRDVDPLKPAIIQATKRSDYDGLYINCNNPEKLTADDMGKALSRVDISYKKVFFTFEHNNYDQPFYYGYQVKNTSNEAIYVTVLNMGFQLDGQGCWLGEKEWVDFYNANFRYDPKNFTEKQKQKFKDYFNFSNNYKTKKYQPITYRIPKGKYIYVMGGTTADSYKHINVFKSADKLVSGGCSNGAVLFEVLGEAEGSFFVYQDPKQIKDNNTHQGYVVNRNGHDYGSQYVGYDNCHGVVDTMITYMFNDLTKSQDLPVEYVNYYDDNPLENPYPYKELNSTPHTQKRTNWVTHINPQGCHEGVGTDMTKYYTINDKNEVICIDADHLDGHGRLANIGNWMMDYMDYFTFINQGEKERTVTINMRNTGSLCVLRRNKKGKLIKNSPMFTIMHNDKDDPEGSINNDFTYTVKVKPHSSLQFILEYNLLANSCGYVTHKVTLK